MSSLIPAEHELVLRKNGSHYFRRIPKGRDFESASINRKKAILQFAETSMAGRGQGYGEHIRHMQHNISTVGMTEKAPQIIELSDQDILNAKNRLMRAGITEFELPENCALKEIVDEFRIDSALKGVRAL